MDGLYLCWDPVQIPRLHKFQEMDMTQSMFNPGSILQLALLGRYPNACFGHKTLIEKPKAQSMNLWFYIYTHMLIWVRKLVPYRTVVHQATPILRSMCKNYELHHFKSITDASHLHYTNWDRTWFDLNVDKYILAHRQLRWLGQHVSRMPFDRLPRRLLSSWLPYTRDQGVPRRWPLAK